MLAGHALVFRKRIDFDLEHFEGVKDAHSDSVSALIGQMPTYSTADFFVRLTDVDRLTIAIIENIDAPFEPANIMFAVFIRILQFCKRLKTLSKAGGLKRRGAS